MNCQNDRPTIEERRQDCLIELATLWIQRDFASLSDEARVEAIDEVCLLISQMRHLDPKLMDRERSRWVERVASRLCHQCPAIKNFERSVRAQLEKRITVTMLIYHEWREKVALPFGQPGKDRAA